MTHLLKAALPLGMMLASAGASAETMKLSANGSRSSVLGTEAMFTGRVTVTPIFEVQETSNVGGGQVEFAPGARSHWHTHPAGQTLVIMSGAGWVQEEGGARIELKPGDVVWTPPGTKHWHGATAGNSMTHLAVTPTAGGKNVDWMEPVTDAQYR